MGFATTAQQVALMFAFILLGLFGARKKWIGPQAVTGMTNILVYFVAPGVIIQAFNRTFSADRLRDLGIVALVDLAAFPLAILLGWLLFRKVRDPDRRRNLRFAAIYSNAGFLGLPLVQALLGPDGVFFAVIFVVVFNIFVWTQGRSMFISGQAGVKELFANPVIPSMVIGIVLFLFSVRLPGFLVTGIGYLAALNAPLSMFVVGASLAGVRWRTFATDPWIWLGTAVRTLLIPTLAILALWPIPLPAEVRLTILIPLACPVAAYLVMFSVLHETDTDFPARLVSLSTLISVLTLPAWVALANTLWGVT